jgi:hypothetical protein
MVYSNPRIAEIDILLLLRGGYVCVELKEGPQRAPEDSLKFFQNGLGSQAVLYISKKPLERGEASNVGVLNPLVIARDNFSIDKLNEWMEHSTEFYKKRREFFSIDNFLCALLMYGSPAVCSLLFPDKKDPDSIAPFDEFEGLDSFIKYRISLIKLVKGLAENIHESYFDKASGNEDEDLSGEKLVILIPTLSPSFLRGKLVDSIKELKGKFSEIVLLCTERSSNHCEELQCKLKGEFLRVEKEIVKLEEWGSKAVEEAAEGGVILLIGEVPKNVLIGLVNEVYSRNIKLASLLWRPEFYVERFSNDLSEIIRGEKCDLGSREEIVLVPFGLWR